MPPQNVLFGIFIIIIIIINIVLTRGDFFIAFGERIGERERCEREKHHLVAFSYEALTRDQIHNLGMRPDQELNL